MQEVIDALAAIPEVIPAILSLVGLLRDTKDEQARRAALDAALAAAEAEVLRRAYPS